MKKRGARHGGVVRIIALGGLALLLSCEEPRGPAERAGEKIDRAIENAKEALDPLGSAEKAGRKIDRAVDGVDN